MTTTSIQPIQPIQGILHRSHVQNRDDLDPEVIMLRRTWYVSSGAPTDVLRALTLGVRLTCFSAATYYGLRTPPYAGLHVFGVHGRYPDPARNGIIQHRLPALRAWPDSSPIAPLDLVLEHVARCQDALDAAILFESALNQHRISLDDANCIVASLPRHLQQPLQGLSRTAESGTETKVRRWLERRGVHVRSQVFIEGVGRVDMLVGENLVIECDSVEYHVDPVQYHRDRERDLELMRQGYKVIRLTWHQVFLAWETTSTALAQKLATRSHRRLPRTH